ncbi:MAG TPA: MFS transporter [Planctomycetaceae bacterium]|nr:MFS transporter [Planctomycetaceae bacterium]
MTTLPSFPDVESAYDDVRNDKLRRWWIVGLLMAQAALLHFNRGALPAAGTEHLIPEGLITETQMGSVYSALLIVYTLCMIPGGWCIDRFGPRRALLGMGFGCAAIIPLTGATALLPATALFLALCAVRGLLGMFCAPMHPGAARSISLCMPHRERGLANGLVTCAAVLGAASTPILFGFLMDRLTWPIAFVVAGLLTAMVTLAWLQGSRGHPTLPQRTTTKVHRGPIEGVPQASGMAATGLVPPSGLSPALISLGFLTVAYAAYSYCQYLFFAWSQYYFDKVLDLGTEIGRRNSTITLLGMAAGMVAGGWLADLVPRRVGRFPGMSLVPLAGMVASGLFLLLGVSVEQPNVVLVCFTLSMASLAICESPFWVNGVALGRRRGGLSGAILNTVGNAGGLVAPIVTPLFSDHIGWRGSLAVAGLICLLGAPLWLMVDPGEDAADRREELPDGLTP